MKHTLVAATVVLLLGLGTSVQANVGAGHGGARAGGFGGGTHMDMGHSSRPGTFGHDRFDGRFRDRGRHGSEVLIFPYPYDPYFDENLDGSSPYDPYCDAYSPYYRPQYCYEGP